MHIIGFVFGSVYTRTEVVNVLTAYVYTLVRMRLLLLFTGDVSYLGSTAGSVGRGTRHG